MVRDRLCTPMGFQCGRLRQHWPGRGSETIAATASRGSQEIGGASETRHLPVFAARTRSSSKRVKGHAIGAEMRDGLRGVKGAYLGGIDEVDLRGSQPLDDVHGAAAAWARPDRRRFHWG